MKLLYVASGHPLSEADDLLMWEKLGIEWFSTGYYRETDSPGDLPTIKRPLSNLNVGKSKSDTFIIDKAGSLIGKKNATYTGQVAKNLWSFDKDFISQFDVIVINHIIENLKNNEKVLAGKKIILKTYARHELSHEPYIEGLHRKKLIKVVRNSPCELERRRNMAHDMIIRGSLVKDEHEVSGWNGDTKQVITFNNTFEAGGKTRANYINLTRRTQYPFILGGANNKMGLGYVKHADKIKLLQDSRVSLCTGSPGANNTYSFVEAWVMGIPIVCFGRPLWDNPTCEPEQLIEHGVTGYIVKNLEDAADVINTLMKNHTLAKYISANARQKAISIYGRDVLARQWTKLFQTLGYFTEPEYVI